MAFVASPSVFRWKRAADGRVKFGRTFARSVGLNSKSKRRNGRARGIYRRPLADSRFPGNQIPPVFRWRLTTLESGGGYSDDQVVFGLNPKNLFGRGSQNADVLFARDGWLPGQFVQLRRLRMTAQGAAPKGVANRKLRRVSAYCESRSGTPRYFMRRPTRKRASAPRPDEDIGYRQNGDDGKLSKSNLQGYAVLRKEKNGAAGRG